MFDKVEGLNDREEMLDYLRFLIRYEKEILQDGMIFSESEFYDELFSTIIMIADDLREEWKFGNLVRGSLSSTLSNIFFNKENHVMEKQIEQRIKGLVSKFHLLRTKEGNEEFDKIWNELKAAIPLEDRREAGRILSAEMQQIRERRKRTDVNVRGLLGDLGNVLSLSYIAQHYFQKDRSWFAQRINGNIVNGKPSAFTESELEILKFALTDIKNKLSETILNIK